MDSFLVCNTAPSFLVTYPRGEYSSLVTAWVDTAYILSADGVTGSFAHEPSNTLEAGFAGLHAGIARDCCLSGEYFSRLAASANLRSPAACSTFRLE